MKDYSRLTIEFLNECFEYCPETGDLIWKVRPVHHFKSQHVCNIFNSKFSDGLCGHVNDSGYRMVALNNIAYRAHRLIWMLIHGEWPDQIDHIDGQRQNNRLDNLRNVTQQENKKNQKRRSSNTSGVTGVYWHKGPNKWRALIEENNKLHSLGYFESFNDAVIARKMAEQKYGFHANHDR